MFTISKNTQDLIKRLTLKEKAKLCSGLDFWHLQGIARLGIPSIMVSDGPHGLRKQEQTSDHLGLSDSIPATCFPSAVVLASSWSRKLINKVGIALSKEVQFENISILLGPGVNIKRSPLCGRNFEYFSEDPYLSSQMALSYIEGVQSQGIGTSIKHFAVNNQEHRRKSVNAVIDERALREIYLASFEEAIKKSKPLTVMSSYNQVNGEFVGESNSLLTDILRNEWGFDGFVISDWGAVNERVDGLKAGLDLEMPSSNGIGESKIIQAIQTGELLEEDLNKSIERLLRIIFAVANNNKGRETYNPEEHHHLAKQAASDGMVLLKNKDNILPISKRQSMSIIGELAIKPRYQGGGSSNVNPTKLDNIYKQIKLKISEETNITYAQGYDLTSDKSDMELINEAKKEAEKTDISILFIGLPERYEAEGYDRTHLDIPENQKQIIEEISKVQSNVIVVLSNGAPIEMPWLHKTKAVLEGYLGGQALGSAIADVIFGDINPSGKLAETFPKKLSDNPSYLNFPGEGDSVEYKEGIFVGYRYYDTKELEPLFPFGFGLSYTTFEYSSLTIDKKCITDTETVSVKLQVKNTGNLFGKEVIQLYIKDLGRKVIRPEKELKAFEKVSLHPGEEKRVTFTLDKRAFAYYSVKLKEWHVNTSDFVILVGKSSRDIVLKKNIHVISTTASYPEIHRNTNIGDLLNNPVISSLARKLLNKATKNNLLIKPLINEEENDLYTAMIKYMPLRGIINFSRGEFTEDMLQNMINRLNEEQEKLNYK